MITLWATLGYSSTPEITPQPLRVAQFAQSENFATLWTIDTRNASYCRGVPLDEAGICFMQKVDGCWQEASREALTAVDKKIPLVVFFHGMWLDRAGGREEGMRLYRFLQKNSSDRPFQFVMWSWPAKKHMCLARRDVRNKVSRTETQAFYVAQWLETLPKDRPICLVGYSLGARVVSSSLELLGGGTICGQSLDGLAIATDEVHVLAGPDKVKAEAGFHQVSDKVHVLKGPAEKSVKNAVATERRPICAVLVAAAIDRGSFLQGHRNGLALSQVERLLVTRNSRDHVLRWYTALYGIGGPQAMGFAGPCMSRLDENRDRLEVLPVTCSVGRAHYWMNYLQSCALRQRLLEYVFEPSVEAVPAE